MKKCEEFFVKNKPTFLFGITNISQLKKYNIATEIAFVGKSNVGKSSLINAITGSKIAISSKTPGRTREINFFKINEKLTFVDMPGYGFAFATEKQKNDWKELIYNYLDYSKSLKIVFILIDCRKSLTHEDIDFMYMLDDLNINYQIVLTKIDHINKNELQNTILKIANESANHKFMNKEVLSVSSSKKYGLFELKNEIYNIL